VLLQRHRQAAGLSQEELAERAALSRRGISDLERGARRAPYPETARRLAQALGLAGPEQSAFLAAAHQPISSESGVRIGSLATPLSSFVGREQELTEIVRLLETTRLLTLTGAGGVGKTRLALRVAADVAAGYAHGVWMVDLAPLADATLVPKAVASALDVREQPGRSLADTIVDALRRRHLLLVLDNCEHLVHASAALAETLLQACPRLRVLTTSRHALRAPGETVWWVPSLKLPEVDALVTAEQVAGSEAVQLFVERARAVGPAFALTDQNAASVAHVCRHLDGIPLALELAAARLLVLSPEQLAARLDDRFKLLTGGSPTALPRQQTLRGTLDWSYELLSELERTLLRRLAVFAGGWTLEAAESVCAGEGLEGDAILDLLAGLVSKSLVVVGHEAQGVRYRLLETVRQYAWERLQAAGEQEDACRRHRDWCLMLGEEAEPRLYRAEQVEWLERLEREHDNLRLALAWTHAQTDGSIAFARLARALWWFWYLHGHFSEGRRWLEQAVSGIEQASLRAGVLLGTGWLSYGRGELDHATDLLEESLTLARERGDLRTAAQAMIALSFTLRDHGQRERSRPLLDECLAVSREIGYRWGAAFALYLMGVEAIWRREYAAAAEFCGQSLPIFRELGERLGLAYTLHELGRLAFDQDDDKRATELYEEGLALSRELGNRRGICFALDGLARGARRRGEPTRATALIRETLVIWHGLGNHWFQAFALAGLAALAAEQHESARAARLFGAAEARLETLGLTLPQVVRPDLRYDEAIARAREELGEVAFVDAWVAGRALSVDQAMDEALAVSAPSPSPSTMTGARSADTALAVLSAREREVAALVARGFSNRQIAETLVIAPRTADTHVGHILDKLGLRSRAQIAAWIVEHGLTTACVE
jgi:predicted ATPase/DNA-binding CsgD family transcriptional regulator/DNA-binding XRE family transcriptional regulator